MKTLQSSKSLVGSPVARTGNYDDYQSYVEDHTQYNKEVSYYIYIFTKKHIKYRWMQHMLLV
jgi:hypothetical protein